jgi:hypothetical protein
MSSHPIGAGSAIVRMFSWGEVKNDSQEISNTCCRRAVTRNRCGINDPGASENDGVHGPVIRLPVRDESADAHDGVVDVLRKFVADRLADLYVGLADEIVIGEVGQIGRPSRREAIWRGGK